ncbi:MAG TPA: PIG-L family deacetylase [Acidimicrobiales bacterium]|nr:PIG-L family deacetylase [Acidimicrobiales bacterium]
MATAVFFHAHPDDEAIATAGTMAALAAAGHRVVLVTATRGELGEVPDGLLAPGETLADRRAVELEAACEVLGVARHVYLGYGDSGMEGEDTNNDPGCFWQADLDEAARRMAAILREEEADVLTAYDERGNYGHPDHIQVHRVGLRAGELAGVPRVFMATVNRDHLYELLETDGGATLLATEDERPAIDNLGVADERITTAVDVGAFLDQKRRAMAAHASQISETSFFLSMPAEAFAAVWGTEWYIRVGAAVTRPYEDSLLPDEAR